MKADPLRDDAGQNEGSEESVELRRKTLELALMAAELKRKNRALSAIGRVSKALVESQEAEEQDLLQRAVEALTSDGEYALAWLGIKGPDPERLIIIAASAGRAREYLENNRITWNDEPTGRSPAGKALRENRVIVTRDITADPDSEVWQTLARRHGLRSAIAIPLVVDGEASLVLAAYTEGVGAFNIDEISLLSELAGSLSVGISAVRRRKQAAAEREHRERLEAQLQQAQKLEAVGTLAGGIAHDFNNLLMVIMAQIELLSSDLNEEAAKRADVVMSSAKRAAELTGQLLAFSRKQTTRPVITPINRIVAGMSEMTKRLIPENIEVRIALCEEPWPVKIDRNQFEQVIMNLVVNARDAMPEGGNLTLETANVETDDAYQEKHPLVPAGRYAMLAVSDNGVGMSPETQARLFEPFFTTKEIGKGTGLGLALVYGIVKNARGFIWVYSELGKGTSFKIYLPYASSELETQELRRSAAPLKRAKTATVLLVEDDEQLREVISEFLGIAGHIVIRAGDIQEATEIATRRKNDIDILLTDVILKGGNGKQLAQEMERLGCRFRAIYMSGYTPSVIVHHGVLEPGISFLQKPFSRSGLLAKIDEALST
jgi:signal transduction histidine kinase